MSYVAEFFDQTAGQFVDVSDRIVRPRTNFEIDIVGKHIAEYQGQSLVITPHPSDNFNMANGSFFRYYKNGGGTPVFYFSGYIKKLIQTVKNGDFKFDVQTESEFLKTVIIPDSLPSSNTFQQ